MLLESQPRTRRSLCSLFVLNLADYTTNKHGMYPNASWVDTYHFPVLPYLLIYASTFLESTGILLSAFRSSTAGPESPDICRRYLVHHPYDRDKADHRRNGQRVESRDGVHNYREATT